VPDIAEDMTYLTAVPQTSAQQKTCTCERANDELAELIMQSPLLPVVD